MARRVHAHQLVSSRKAPRPLGPYAHGVRVEQAGATLYTSGQIPIELPVGQPFVGAFKRQAELALTHLRNVVLDAGFRVEEVVRVTAYLVDMAQMDAFNEAYTRCFAGLCTPARTVVGVASLPRGVAIEVDAIAVRAQEAPPPPPPDLPMDDGY